MMNSTYKKLLKLLHEKYPKKHISITLNNNYYGHNNKYAFEYFVYVEDVESKHLPTLSEVKEYVESLRKKEVE